MSRPQPANGTNFKHPSEYFDEHHKCSIGGCEATVSSRNQNRSRHLEISHGLVHSPLSKQDKLALKAKNQLAIDEMPTVKSAQGKPELNLPTSCDQALMELIATSRLPFSIVRDPSFERFVDCVKKAKNWKLPHRTLVATSLLDQLYHPVQNILKATLLNLRYIALTMDGTTGPNGVPYWSVTAAGLNENFEMVSAILACVPVFKRHSGENLADVLLSVMGEIGVDAHKVVAIVTDEGGGAPCVAQHFPNAAEIHCAAHLLQTSLRNAFDNTVKAFPILGQVLTFAKSLASHFNQSGESRLELSVLKARLQLSVSSIVQEVATRWLSSLVCMKSILKSRPAIEIWLKSLPPHAAMKFDKYSERAFRESFWIILERLVSMLESFQTATEMLSVERMPSMSESIDQFDTLQSFLDFSLQSLQKEPSISEYLNKLFVRLINELKMSLTQKFEPWSDFELAAVSLNPLTRCNPTEWMKEQILKGDVIVKRLMARETAPETINAGPDQAINANNPQESQTGPQNPHDEKARNRQQKKAERVRSATKPVDEEFEKFLEAAEDASNLADFWKRGKESYPRLFAVALKVFSSPCSQTASEREFSLLRLICTHLRGRLSPSTVNKLLVSSAYLKTRNARLAADGKKTRTKESIDADVSRLRTLLNTNRRKTLDLAMENEAAAIFATMDLDSLLNELSIPESYDNDDLSDITMHEDDTGFLSGDEDYDDDEAYKEPSSKRSKTSDDEIVQSRSSRGYCLLHTVTGHTTLMSGTWKSSDDIAPTKSMIFRSYAKYVLIEVPDDHMDIEEPEQLPREFRFELTQAGKKKYNGRRQFISEVGERVLFD